MAKTNMTFVRKHFFIDRNFQGRYMLTLFIPMIVMLIFMLGTLYFVSQTIMQVTVRTLRQSVESKITVQLQDSREPSVQEYKALVDNINDYIRTFANSQDYKKNVLSSLLLVMGAGLILVILQLVLLTVFFSHKIAGPVYRFEKVCNNMIEGNYTDIIKLRKGDEMQNLGLLLNEVGKVTRQRMVSLANAENDDERKKILSTMQL